MTPQGKENFKQELVELINKYSSGFVDASNDSELIDSLANSIEAFENETDNEKQVSMDNIYKESERLINYSRY